MSQFLRVVSVAKGSRWLTLRQIEQTIANRFAEYDTTPAISARLRDSARLAAIGLKKESRHEMRGRKQVWWYRLVKI